jgi:hypothetical protein
MDALEEDLFREWWDPSGLALAEAEAARERWLEGYNPKLEEWRARRSHGVWVGGIEPTWATKPVEGVENGG